MAENDSKITRRGALGLLAGAVGAGVAFGAGCTSEGEGESNAGVAATGLGGAQIDPAVLWQAGGYVVHETVDVSRIARGEIRAYVDGRWQEFKNRQLPATFVEWSFSARLDRLENLAKNGFQKRDLAGPHNACVATVGGPTRDSSMSLNTAYKGLGFAPRPDVLVEVIDMLAKKGKELDERAGGVMMQAIFGKTQVLADLYREPSLFDPTKQISLELFTAPDYATHTFLNMMMNPIASATFLDFPTFEIRAIPQFIHMKNPQLTDQERLLATWSNTIHDFIHGGPGNRIACVYHVVEVFDDSPNNEGKGRRLV